MKRIIALIVTLNLTIGICLAQCSQPSFSLPTAACQNQNLTAVNSQLFPATYSWDFCDGSIGGTPTALMSPTLSNSSLPSALAVQKENGKYYAFIAHAGSNRISRHELSADLQSINSSTDLGVVGFEPRGIAFHKEGPNFYALVADYHGKIFRLSFGESLLNTPAVSLVVTLPTGDLRNLRILKEGGVVFAFVTGGGSNAALERLTFGTTILNTPIQLTIPTAAAPFLNAIDFIKECDQWYAFIEGYNSIHRLNFGQSLSTVPTISTITSFVAAPLNIFIRKSNDQYFGFVPTAGASGGILRLNFGTSLTNLAPTVTDMGTFGSLALAIGVDFYKDQSKHFAVAVNYSNNKLTTLDFPKACNVINSFDGEASPTVTYSTPGTFTVTLTATSNTGVVSSVSRSIAIGTNSSPDINIQSQNICEGHDVSFTSLSNSSGIIGYDWDFGDGTSLTSVAAATHQYNAGEYTAKLIVNASNGCTNTAVKQLKIYPVPASSFTAPSGVLCTNNEFTFTNTTTDIYDGNLAYQWYLNDQQVSTSRNLTKTFNTAGIYSVKLKTSIPGCENLSTPATVSLFEGPTVNFSVAEKKCEDAPVQFYSDISETVTSRQWNFSDTGSANSEHPSHTFSNAGVYNVTLTVTNTTGCNNSKTLPVTIYSVPQPDFVVPPAPLSCTDREVPFENLTPTLPDSEVASWVWTFLSESSSSAVTSTSFEPKFIYPTAGAKAVSLRATTNHGCTNILQKTVDISRTPELSINKSATCLKTPSNFSVSTEGNSSYYWEIGSSYYDSGPLVSHTFNAPGTYPVKITVIGNNSCIGNAAISVNVPVPLIPSYTYEKHCLNHDAVFTDTTPAGSDPIQNRKWTIAGTIQENTSVAIFPVTNSQPIAVTLQVKGQSNCVYTTPIQTIPVQKAPEAIFTATPTSGAAPLKVKFTNQSKNASSYRWTFLNGPGATSETFEPEFTFKEIGEHKIYLLARNAANCEDTADGSITAEVPAPDVTLDMIDVIQNPDKTLKVIVTIRNNGNTILKNLPVKLDFSGELLLSETIREEILPGALYNLVSPYGVNRTKDLNFVCAEALLENDHSTAGNRTCIQFEKNLLILTPYPNPVKDNLSIEWIGKEEQRVEVIIADTFGKILIQTTIESAAGLNRHTFDVTTLKGGIYFLTINDGTVKKTQRVVISAKN